MGLPTFSSCAYCGLRLAPLGDSYCCDGCRTLASLQDQRKDALVRKFGQNSDGETSHFVCYIDSPSCQSCLQSLTSLDEFFPSLTNLEWNRQENTLAFDFTKGKEDPQEVFATLKGLGLAPRWKTADSQDVSKRQSRERLLRLGIAGALAGNIMLFAIPYYVGLDDVFSTAFEWIQFLLFLPVFLYCAQPFYRTAWLSFQMRHFSIDLPLTLAFVLGSGFSFYSLVRGTHQVYFDSLSGFLFLILASRFLLERSLAWQLKSPSLDHFFENPIYNVRRDGKILPVPWDQIEKDDVVLLESEQRVPVDGFLQSSAAEFETSWMNGEHKPKLRLQGARIEAGVVVLSNSAEIKAQTPARETAFAELLGKLVSSPEKIRLNPEAKWGAFLVIGCFLAIVGLMVLHPGLELEEFLRRSVAILIVACPCAVSFGIPLARARAAKVALQKGFWIRDPSSLELVNASGKIAFDKTGTLTGSFLQLAPHSPILDARIKRIILSLENVSNHPIAGSLRKAWGALGLLPVENAQERIGIGVEGWIDGEFYELKRVASPDEYLHVELFKDGRSLVGLDFQEEPLPHLKETLRSLGLRHEIFLISGDQSKRVVKFAENAGLSEGHAFGNLNPQGKLAKLEEIAPDLYIGDGTNDILALKKAPVSIAVADAAFEAKTACDILMLNPDLRGLPTLFQIAREARMLVRRNLSLALAYNLGAGAAAWLGLVQPLAAAVLMPAASLLILASTLLGTKRLRIDGGAR